MVTDRPRKSTTLCYIPLTACSFLSIGKKVFTEMGCLGVKVTVENKVVMRDDSRGYTVHHVKCNGRDNNDTAAARCWLREEFTGRLAALLRSRRHEGHALAIWHTVLDMLATCSGEFLRHPFSFYLNINFAGAERFDDVYRSEIFRIRPHQRLKVRHPVGGDGSLKEAGLNGGAPDDGCPVLLRNLIRSDCLTTLKIMLFGSNLSDYLSNPILAALSHVLRLQAMECQIPEHARSTENLLREAGDLPAP